MRLYHTITTAALITAAALFPDITATAGTSKQRHTDLQSVISALAKTGCYTSKATFNVTMPQLNDDVIYTLSITQTPAPADTLLPCTYLIDWAITSREDPVRGFTAYFDGNHYRYAGERMQEYHMVRDPIPFTARPAGRMTLRGVQRTAQFANLLPATIAEELERMRANPDFTLTFHPDTLISGQRCVALEAVMRINGATSMEATYTFDASTLMPQSIVFENNPGSVSEQTVCVRYSDTSITSGCPPVSEQMLMKLHTHVFENFRESNFRIENLTGSRLPGFALLTTTGERYMRRTGDKFAVPTIVALLDGSHSYTPMIVTALRNAIDNLPYNADLIMAFVDKHVDTIEEIVPELRPGEHLLMGAKPLVRDCGAASLPAILLTDASATVRDVTLGYNNDLATDVIQKMALIPAGTSYQDKDKTQDTEHNITATSMETVYFKEQPCHTYGYLPETGSQAPAFNLTGANLAPVKSDDFKGKTIVLNIFPSLDTEVCARSVRRFNHEASQLDDTSVICVSQDLPFAMSRFCTVEGLDNVIPASSFRSPQFGEKYGVMLVDGPLAGLLTRAVIVIGPDGVVKYRELVNEITSEPDYEAALEVIKGKF